MNKFSIVGMVSSPSEADEIGKIIKTFNYMNHIKHLGMVSSLFSEKEIIFLKTGRII